MSLFEKINKDLQKALKEKNTLRLETIRMMKSKILYINPKGELSDEEIIKILNKYAKTLKEAVEEAKKVNRIDVAEKTEKELQIVREYLPKELSPEELKQVVKKTIKEVGATSMKEMGAVMKEIMGKCPTADGKIVKNLVAQELKEEHEEKK